MAVRREIVVILGLVIFVLIMIPLIDFIKKNVDQADVNKLVLEDIKTKYPGADVAIISTTEKSNEEGGKYYEIKARVTNDPAGSCPERTHIYYNYPEQNFVLQPTEYITKKNCKVCEVGTCVLAFPEEAIIASHTFPGTEVVNNYLSQNTYATPAVSEQFDGWLVSWNSPLSSYTYDVKLTRNGSVVSVLKKEKDV